MENHLPHLSFLAYIIVLAFISPVVGADSPRKVDTFVRMVHFQNNTPLDLQLKFLNAQMREEEVNLPKERGIAALSVLLTAQRMGIVASTISLSQPYLFFWREKIGEVTIEEFSTNIIGQRLDIELAEKSHFHKEAYGELAALGIKESLLYKIILEGGDFKASTLSLEQVPKTAVRKSHEQE